MAAWELRVGDLRVFYEVIHDERDVVRVLAVGANAGTRLSSAARSTRVKRTKKNADWEVTGLGLNPEFFKLVAAARARFAAGRKISLDELKRAALP